MSMTLGEKLRQAREARGFSISEVAEQTRISALYLESIENDDYKILPGGIFNKGFIKSYAKYVGLDEKEALADYQQMQIARGELEEDKPTTRPEVLTDDRQTSLSAGTIVFAVLLIAALVGGVLFLRSFLSGDSPAISNLNANSGSNAAPVATPTPTPTPPVTELRAEFQPIGSEVNVTYWADGQRTTRTVRPNEPLTMTAKDNLRISYYRGFTADKVRLTLNGKAITPPAPPARGNILIFEINKENAAQIMQSGKIPDAPAAATPAAR